MKFQAVTVICLSLLLCSAPAFGRAFVGDHYGQAFTDAPTVTLEAAMSKIEELNGKTVKIEGKVADVCQMKGCWLVLTDGEREIRVAMQGHDFFVPKNIGGKRVVVEGILERQTETEEQAKHYAGESTRKVEPGEIEGDKVVVAMLATGVSVE